MKSKFFVLVLVLSFCAIISAQPPRPQGSPEWVNLVDTNKNGRIEREEFAKAADLFFKNRDKNNNGILEENELPQKPRGDRRGNDERRMEERRKNENEVPPFLFLERGEVNLTRAEFDEKSNQRFISADKNGDGAIDMQEIRFIRPPREDNPERQPPPNARFLEAEMRFGDRLVKNAPFSAEIIIENTRRLFDGSIITSQNKGAIFRDGAGRTRREQTIDKIGSFSIGEPQKIVLINDFDAKTHYFLDVNRKTFRRQPIDDRRPPKVENEPQNGTTESLGTKMLEGVKVEGTRTIFEIPVGQIGNDKPIQVITEKWYSPELQMIVMSRHVDPLAGEQVFRLVNIKLGEPSADLFSVPKDFKSERN
jgi:Ca2+-binding EF-hand superfamily protein